MPRRGIGGIMVPNHGLIPQAKKHLARVEIRSFRNASIICGKQKHKTKQCKPSQAKPDEAGGFWWGVDAEMLEV